MDENLDTQNEQPIEVSMDDTITNAWKDIQARDETPRDEVGKFAAKETPVTPQVATEATPESTETPPETVPEVPAIKPPSSWKKETQAKFSTLPPDIQAEIIRREDDQLRGIKTYKDSADKYERAIAPYKQTIESLGRTPDQAISGLLQTDATLRNGSPSQKVAMVQRIIEEYGIKPEWFVDTQQANPEVGHLESRLAQYEAQQARIVADQQAREQELLNSNIQDFAKNNEHFEAVRERMGSLLQGGAAQTLQEAYDMAVWADPTVRAALLAKQQAEERAKAMEKVAQAKQVSKVNVPRRGVIPAQTAVGTMDDTIRAAAKELGLTH